MFNTAIDSKLRGCDLVKLRVADVHLGDSIRLRTTVVQQKTGRPVPFELTDHTREALAAWLKKRGMRSGDWLFLSRSHVGDNVTTRQYSRLVDDRVTLAGLDPAAYGPTACAGPRWHSFISAQATCGPVSSCSAMRNSKAPSAISGSKSMTPRSCPSRPIFEEGRGGPAPPPLDGSGRQSPSTWRVGQLPLLGTTLTSGVGAKRPRRHSA